MQSAELQSSSCVHRLCNLSTLMHAPINSRLTASAYLQQVCVQPRALAVNMTLLAFAAGRPPLSVEQSLLLWRLLHRQTEGQTDGWTPYRLIDADLRSMRPVSITYIIIIIFIIIIVIIPSVKRSITRITIARCSRYSRIS